MFEIGIFGVILGMAVVPLLFGLTLGMAFFFRGGASVGTGVRSLSGNEGDAARTGLKHPAC